MPLVRRTEAIPDMETRFKHLSRGDMFTRNGTDDTDYFMVVEYNAQTRSLHVASGMVTHIDIDEVVFPFIRGETISLTQR